MKKVEVTLEMKVTTTVEVDGENPLKEARERVKSEVADKLGPGFEVQVTSFLAKTR